MVTLAVPQSILNPLTCMRLENLKPWIPHVISVNNLNASDGYMPVHTKILHTDCEK